MKDKDLKVQAIVAFAIEVMKIQPATKLADAVEQSKKAFKAAETR